MTPKTLADWLQVLGNLGLVLGLIFVGIQLYQDRQLKLAELRAAHFEARIMANSAAMGDAAYKSIVKAATDPESMTTEDAYIFLLNLDNWRSLDLRSASLERLGLYTESWQEYSGLILEAQTPMGVRDTRRWVEGGTNYPPAFRDKVEALLNDPKQLDGFRERLEWMLEQNEPSSTLKPKGETHDS